MFSVIHAEKGILRFKMEKEWEKPENKDGLHIIKVQGGTVINAVPNLAEVWLGGAEGVLADARKQFLTACPQGESQWKEDALCLCFRDSAPMRCSPGLGKMRSCP